MKYFSTKNFLIIFLSVLFLFISLITLKDYGVGTDEPLHFLRGQAYLHYYLTGEKQFSNLDNGVHSYYESPSLSADYWIHNDGGHPILNDMLASLTNHIFYQNLGIMNDIDAYQLFNIITATLSVFIVTVFAYKTYGWFASLIAALTLSSFPLFFGESHFNVKDPAQSAFYTLTVFAFWMSLKKGNWKFLLLAICSFAVSFSMKWNILFLPMIMLPYLILRYFSIIKNGPRNILSVIGKIPKSYLTLLLFSPVIVLSIFFAAWPFLWEDPIGNFWEVIKWHEMLGTGYTHDGMFIFGHFNIYAPFWIFATTPPWVLFLTFIGLIFAIKDGWDKEKTTLLWVIWFLVPIIRVSMPDTVIYGGIRQIMEFIPAMALLSGLGAFSIYKWIISRFKGRVNGAIIYLLIILCFLPQLFVLVKLHPNENVYVNSLVGGLPAVKAAGVPYWGNSFGNGYWQMMQWLNQNAEKNSKLALIQGTGLNIPKIKLRPDIAYSNAYWSGINREGEYLIELTHQDSIRLYPYAWDYVEKFLETVYEVKVDGVTIAKVWKNDLAHTKPEFKKNNIRYTKPFKVEVKDSSLIAILEENVLLTVLTIPVDSKKCVVKGKVLTSLDGTTWSEEPDQLPTTTQLGSKTDNLVTFYFSGKKAKYLKLELDSMQSCVLENPNIRLSVLDNS